MAAFNDSNLFLNSTLKEKYLCPNPTTERGAALQISAHPTLPIIVYPTGKFIVFRNLANPADSFIYRGHNHATSVAKFAPNGFWVASGDVSGKLRVWAWDNPEHGTKLETSVFAGKIADLDWDSESKKIVVGGEGSGIIVKCLTWDTGNTVGEMVGHNKRILSVSYKPSRPFRIITSSEDMRTCFYAGPPFKLDHSNNAHTNFVNCVRYSPNGERAVSVGSDKKIQMYDGKTGEMTSAVADAHAGGIYSVAFSPESTHFITASADKTLKLWNAETLALEQTFTISSDPQIGDAQVAVVWTKACLVSVSLNGNINVLNRASPDAPERVIQSHQVSISAMTLDRATQTLYTGSYDGVVCGRDLTGNNDAHRLTSTGKAQINAAVHNGQIAALAVVHGGVVSIGWDDKMRFASVSAGGAGAYHTEVALDGQPRGLATCLAATDLVFVVTSAGVALYRGAQKVGGMSVAELGFEPTCVALFNEEEVAIGGADFKTHIYALNNLAFSPLKVIETRSAVTALAYHPSGECLAIGDAGRQIELYHRGTWEVRSKGKWVFHTSRISCLAWSPEGKYLASGSVDESIYIWNATNESARKQIALAHSGGVSGLDWLAEGKLVSTGSDCAVVTWNVPAFE